MTFLDDALLLYRSTVSPYHPSGQVLQFAGPSTLSRTTHPLIQHVLCGCLRMLLRTTSVLCSAQHRSAHCTSQLTSTYALPRHIIRPKRSVSVAAIAAARDSSTCALHASASSVSDPELVQQGTPLHAAKIDSSYDAIVIGSGMGGLTAAVGLSKFGGQKVLVLEQHYTAGGFTGAFRRGK